MNSFQKIKIITSSFDARNALSMGKTKHLISGARCEVYGHNITGNLVELDTEQSKIGLLSKGTTTYDLELNMIIQNLIKYLPQTDNIDIVSSKYELTKALTHSLKMIRTFLKSSQGIAAYEESNLDDLIDYMLEDICIINLNTKCSRAIYNNLKELLPILYEKAPNIIFNVSHYLHSQYRSYHKGDMNDIRIAKYTKNGKITADHIIKTNEAYQLEANNSNILLKLISATTDKLANFSSSRVSQEISMNRTIRRNASIVKTSFSKMQEMLFKSSADMIAKLENMINNSEYQRAYDDMLDNLDDILNYNTVLTHENRIKFNDLSIICIDKLQ